MIYFCADDYGVSEQSNNRIEECLKNSVLNKISVLPNGELGEFNNLIGSDAVLSLHLNLVEGFPLSKQATVSLLTTKQGHFKYSFIGLFFASFLPNRKELEKQIPEIYEMLRKGSMEAKAVAAKTLDEVKASMKINYFDDLELIQEQAKRFEEQ